MNESLSVRFSEAQRNEAVAAAKEHGITVSEFVRRSVVRADRVDEAIRLLTVDGLRFGAGCDNRSCACKVPGLPCSEFMGIDETGEFCPRCGWEKKAHASVTSVGEEPGCKPGARERDAGSIPATDTPRATKEARQMSRRDEIDFDDETRTIRRWLNHQVVATDALAAELRKWADYWTPKARNIPARDQGGDPQ